MDSSFGYVFPAIRGIQAGREYYITMCPLRLIPRIFSFDDEELPPEIRAQRILNKGRVPEMARYILNNRDGYTFSALTASIDAQVEFEALSNSDDRNRVGLLHIPMDARFIINDGQHRRAAIEMALRENPELADETISVVFFLDLGLERCQQMFADLNRYAIRPSKSLGVLYDHRDEAAQLAKQVAFQSDAFRNLVELEKTSLSMRARKLFTLSSVYTATKELVSGQDSLTFDEAVDLCVDYWNQVAKQFPEWGMVRTGKMPAGEVRSEFIHTHAIVLQALGRAGNSLLNRYKKQWPNRLSAIQSLDWTRSNTATWEGRAMIGGRVSKAAQNVVLTTNVIKTALGLPLSPEEQRTEDAFKRGHNGE